MRKGYGDRVRVILDTLAEYGPMTMNEVREIVNVPKNSVAATLSSLHRNRPQMGKRIHVKTYVFDAEGSRRYPRAVYALGDLPDAIKPKSDEKEIKRRYLQNRKRKYTMNSVFNMGKTRDQIRAEMRGV
jgi:hypothetical protein